MDARLGPVREEYLVTVHRFHRDSHKSVKNPKSHSWDGFVQQELLLR